MAGGGDVQIGNQERAKIENELNQIRAWRDSIRTHANDLQSELSGDVPTKYRTDYDFGNSLCKDITDFIQDIFALCTEIGRLVSKTAQYIEEHAETNAGK